MALPNQLKSARMTDATLGSDIDNKVAEIEQALCDIFGFVINTNVTESPSSFDNSGRFTKALLRQLAAGPVGWRFRDSSSGKEFRLVLSGTNILVDENTGSEGTPTWTNRATMAIGDGVWTFTGIPVGPSSSCTTDNQLARKKYVDDRDALDEKLASKNVANGYCGLDASTLVLANKLGTGTPSGSNYLRGDRSWQSMTAPTIPKAALLQNRQNSGVDGGSVTAGSWEVYPLNVEQQDPDGIITPSLPSFQLPAGTFLIIGAIPFYNTGGAQAQFYNVDDGVTALLGSVVNGGTSNNTSSDSHIFGVVTIATPKTFRVETRVTNTRATDGLGNARGWGVEVYGQLSITKLT
jgi:hypothetical protein